MLMAHSSSSLLLIREISLACVEQKSTWMHGSLCVCVHTHHPPPLPPVPLPHVLFSLSSCRGLMELDMISLFPVLTLPSHDVGSLLTISSLTQSGTLKLIE